MRQRLVGTLSTLWLVLALLLIALPANAGTSWTGIVTDSEGHAVINAIVVLRSTTGQQEYRVPTRAKGEFALENLTPQTYRVFLVAFGKEWAVSESLIVPETAQLIADLKFDVSDHAVHLIRAANQETEPTGRRLSSKEVSSLPLNQRDFSKLLLLAAGTMTDTNGAANFTQQFSVNGQRGVSSMFAIDGADVSDPEMGGATFANFDVDAIQEVQSTAGVMLPEFGRGAGGGFTNVITKAGSNQVHGSVFEFIRNAALDARNFFDHSDGVDSRRLPPFNRNEFGVTVGGPILVPGIYSGREKTFFFGEYQGFRQVLGTTQVFAVPTADERRGIDTTTFPGDTLYVPVSPAIAPLLARYPLPNNPRGAFGERTYATSSKVVTNTNQFSIRIDHRLNQSAALFGRFSMNQVDGPTTNPDQTAIDPNFGVNFFDHQRNVAIRYEKAITPHLNLNLGFGYIRSTPIFPTRNSLDPALAYGDGLYQGFNSADGSILGSYSNLYQERLDIAWSRGAHNLKWGVEVRLNHDATIWGLNPNGVYTFGGGTAYSPVQILSASGQHNLAAGSPLPDALTGLLTATPYSYTVSAASDATPHGNRFDEAAVRREAYNFYLQDSWKISPRVNIVYGLRYEVNSRIKEAKHRTSMAIAVDGQGQRVSFLAPGARQIYVFNPQPIYPMDWGGLGPRVSADYAAAKRTSIHVGAALTTLLPNLWQDNAATGGFPLVFQPLITALPGAPVPFHTTAYPTSLPDVYTNNGQLLFHNGNSEGVAANTAIDVGRFQKDVEALTLGHEPQLVTVSSMWSGFRNGYVGTYTVGFNHDFGAIKLSSSYIGAAGIHLANLFAPNGYNGADASFAPFTDFDSQGRAIGGYGPEMLVQSGSHSTYHAMQTSVTQNSSHWGLAYQASYTFSKSIDDTSTAMGSVAANAGAVVQGLPQNPHNPRAEKGPSTFDVNHGFSLSLIQMLPFDRVSFLQPLGKKMTEGWQLLNVTSISSGPPFTVYSGIQQTGAGSAGSDRPDLVSTPHLSTGRTVREDYFGRGSNNSSFFSIPIHVANGTGPNQGVFGTLGRDTFRGPGFHQLDFALIKDTPIGHHGGEWGTLQFRAEFFNIVNVVNFGLPSNTVLGSGFGVISKTAGPSRQIQFALRFAF